MKALVSYLYLRFVILTSRIHITAVDQSALHILDEKRPAIFVFWHCHIFFLIYFFSRKQFWTMMNPLSKHDALTTLALMNGLPVAKGSLEGGGRHALVTLIEKLKKHNQVALAADSPRGPDKKCKAGPFILAQETHTPLIPVTWYAKKSWKISSQGNYLLLPRPFSSLEIRLGTPLYITQHHGFSDLDSDKELLTKHLENLSQAVPQPLPTPRAEPAA